MLILLKVDKNARLWYNSNTIHSQSYSNQTFRTIYAFGHNVNGFGNWEYAVGSYAISVECTFRKNSENSYTMSVIYELHDVYDWENKSETIGYLPVTQKDMWELHHGGLAKNYEVYGKNEFTVTWTAGQTLGGGAVLSNES